MAGPRGSAFYWSGTGWTGLGFHSNSYASTSTSAFSTTTLDLSAALDTGSTGALNGLSSVHFYGGINGYARLMVDGDSYAPNFGEGNTSGSAWTYGKQTAMDAGAQTLLLTSPGYVRDSDGSAIGRVDIVRRTRSTNIQEPNAWKTLLTLTGGTDEALGTPATQYELRSVDLSWDGSRFAAQASQVTRVYEIRDDSVYGIDTDNDGAPDTCDLDCLAAGLQADDDDDGDGILDIDDPDADGDGVADNNPIDSDGDGLLDDVDADRDNDGVLNGDDAFPDVSMGLLVDTDRDGRPDECDAACEQRGMTADDDDDGDGIADSDDLYPLISLRRTEAVQLGLDIPYRGRLQMSADGLTIVISDPNEGSNDLNNNGAVRVFRYIDGAWDQMGDTIVGANEADYAGWGVALSEDGSTLGVGFPGEATFRGDDYGVVRVYTWDGAAWVQRGNDIYQPGETNDNGNGGRFGRALDFNETNDTLVAGTTVFFVRYEWSTDDWVQTGSHVGHNSSRELQFVGDRVLAGPRGSAFYWSGTGWTGLGFLATPTRVLALVLFLQRRSI